MLPPPSHSDCSIGQEYLRFLQPDNPQLIELKQAYKRINNEAMDHSLWNDWHVQSQLHLPYFRGDNAYLWQQRDGNHEKNYIVAAEYISGIDRFDLLNKLTEDDAFGVYTYRQSNGRLLSRDLLDSINEIYFLEDSLEISHIQNLNLLDIGAGYGRLAYRMVKALANINSYLCVDAIAESTFLSNFYLHYRNVHEKAKVIPFYGVENLDLHSVDVALAVHSFTGCTLNAIDWWLNLLNRYQVPYLMVVPHSYRTQGKMLISTEREGGPLVYEHLFYKYGYRLIRKQPKYLNKNAQNLGVSPTYYYLYEFFSGKGF